MSTAVITWALILWMRLRQSIKLTLKKDAHNIIGAIGFNMGELAENYCIGDKVDIVGNIEINTYNGEDSLQIVLKDIMKSI